MRFDTVVALGLALALTGGSALGQDLSTVPEPLLGMVGDWRLEQEDQSLPVCALIFTEDQVPGGWQIALPEPCPLPFPSPNQLVAWSVDDTDGAVLILNAAAEIVLRLIEGEDGLFMTEPGIIPAFYLMLPWDEDGMGGEVPDE
jgi:hypothetical protein